jgi:toluene monooxygenase system ferredoxin subunit
MSAAVRWVTALPASELWEGDLADVELMDEPVLLAHLSGGELRAYQGHCPHQEVLLADGEWDADSGVLVCSGHRWEFDLRSGVGINPDGCRLYAYGVRLRGDQIEVGIPQDGRPHHNRATSS